MGTAIAVLVTDERGRWHLEFVAYMPDWDGWELGPTWSPDGTQVAFYRFGEIWVIAVPPMGRNRVIDLDRPRDLPLTIDEESWGRVKGRYYKE
jgi:hypothetical protein